MRRDELYHFGIKGRKWGVRRFQNEDGSLTPVGKKRYDNDSESYSTVLGKTTKDSKRTMRLKKKIAKSMENEEELKNWEKEIKAKGGTEKYSNSMSLTAKDIRDWADETRAKTEKMQVKLLKSQYRDQIRAGESKVMRIYDSITGADKAEANMMYGRHRQRLGKID